jgi:hypothetical protein
VTVLALLGVGILVLAAAAGWTLPSGGRGSLAVAGVLAASLASLGLLAVLTGPVARAGGDVAATLLVALFVVAAAGGGPLTATVLTLADGGAVGRTRGEHAEAVLRGGAWIGVLERAAVFATLAAGWPEGLAVVLALKGLGRYNELRADSADGTVADRGGVAERFLIGSFTSLLWAVACAGAFIGLAD